MKILLKILVAPFALALSLLAALLVFLFDICALPADDCLCDPDGAGCRSLFHADAHRRDCISVLAFLLSPYGLQAAAGSLLWALDGGKSALYRFLAS